jgi:BirA family biotin operon repressor/biotin-[acetyl-CoA-carboxylase] ligase
VIESWPEGVGIRRYGSIDSTNDEARRLAEAGEQGPLWIVAREQEKGRGRRGRTWVSESGNLFATLLTRASKPVSGQLAFAAGLAAGESVAQLAPSIPVTLKWPNDVLLDGRKVSGILLESFGDALAIGIGINLAHYPADTEFPATSVKGNTGRAPDPDDVLPLLAGAMAAWYEVWRDKGFSPVREAWLARASHLGGQIRARLEGGEIKGMFEGLDEDGALLLRMADGARRRIAAGDVFF